MSKLKKLKKAFEDNAMSEMLPMLAHNSWCSLELGKSFYPSIDQLDDLYCGMVAGVLGNLGSGKTPEYVPDLGPDPKDRHSEENYMKLYYCLSYEFGGQAFPREEWLVNHPESEDWAVWIEKALAQENVYKSNPEIWLGNLRRAITEKRMK
jgi:hypothetical protein